MAELKELLFGLKPNEPIPPKFENLARELRSIEKLASFIECENQDDFCVSSSDLPGQMQQTRTDQVRNYAGGYVFKVSDLNRIRRFLILGTAGGTYYTTEKNLTMENVKDMCEIIQRGKGLVLLREILDISLSGRAPKQDSTLFALALCARYKVCDPKAKIDQASLDEFAKRNFFGDPYKQGCTAEAYFDYQKGLQLAALYAVPKVCRIPTHLFTFLNYCKLVSMKTGFKENSKGWGRAMRETISNWYFNIEPERLAFVVTKYQSRVGYTHRDLFRLCHITPKLTFPETHNYWKSYEEYDFLFNYIVNGMVKGKKRKTVTNADDEHTKKKQKEEKPVVSKDDAKMGIGDHPTFFGAEQLHELREKMANLFRDKWDEGLDESVKKTVEERMEDFINGTVQDILVKKNREVIQQRKETGHDVKISPEIREKKEKLRQDLKGTKTYAFINAYEIFKGLKVAQDIVKMIEEHGFVREHVPTEFLNTQEVWGALLREMPMTAMLRNLGKMASVGLLTEDEKNKVHVARVLSKLLDEKAIKDARVHPVGVLLAASVYKAGAGIKGSLKWKSLPEINDALDKAFLLAFKNVTPTNKRYCIGLDVSGSMGALISGTHLSCREAASALSTVLLRTEPEVEVLAFSDKLTELSFTRNVSLSEVLQRTERLDFGSTDCALPMLWAKEHRKKFDVFVVYTDNETWFGEVHPFEALKQYREAMELPDARLVVMGMTATNFTIADPTDAGMMDICGFDSAVPDILKEFVMGRI